MGFISDIIIATDHFSGSLQGTASYAISASWAPTQEFVTGSVTSASYASTASYVFLEELALSSGYMSDAQAAAAGVPIGGIYRNGNFIQIRIS
jgi:hypothetical protein